ncbi:MAG: Panacea domain-containing protein [Halobacteriota archaeon]
MVDILDIEFDKEKFKQVLHYIIQKCGYLENVGKTVLYKILYFSDFDFYELYEEKLTGESYYRLEHGPAPAHFDEAIKELEKEEKVIRFTTTRGGFDQHKFVSCEEPNRNLLNEEELKVIDDDIAKYSHMNATRISAFSHGDLPYKATRDGEIINYEKVFYRDPLFSVREYEEDD